MEHMLHYAVCYCLHCVIGRVVAWYRARRFPP